MNQNSEADEVSSCHEIEEMRREAEIIAILAVERRMNEIIRVALREEEEEIVGERNALSLELQNETRSINTCRELLATAQQEFRNQLVGMMRLQTQLTDAIEDAAYLHKSLQELLVQNNAILRADPIYNLIEEERDLQNELEERGIYVYPPTGSDQSYLHSSYTT